MQGDLEETKRDLMSARTRRNLQARFPPVNIRVYDSEPSGRSPFQFLEGENQMTAKKKSKHLKSAKSISPVKALVQKIREAAS
jgi:hypothetical protein